MPNETTQSTSEVTEQTGAAAQSGERTFTQEEVNRMVGDARTKERKKYEGYVDGSKLAELQQQAESAQKELDALKAAQAHADAVAAAAKSAGIPVEVVQMLNGADADQLAEQAKQLLKLLPVHPTRTDDGGARAAAKKTNAQLFAEAINAARNK